MDTDHPQKIGPYDILGVIGKGAMGKVYKAARPPVNKIVAIKVLPTEFMADEERVERFNREALAITLLDHPNVVKIIEKNQEDDTFYFVMEYVPGASLNAILRQRRLSLPEAIRVFKGVCKGLEAAHQQSIVHRDLSPRNILVSEDLSVVKIADFGISRIETISQDQGTLSTTEFSLGSLHYIAPEQARNMVSADHRADIYSLGVLLYEMLTGRVPVGRFNLPSQLNSEVPPEIDPIVLRCLEVEPRKRYPTMRRLLKEVGRLEDQLRLGLVHEVRGIGSQTSKMFLKPAAGGRAISVVLIAAGAVGLTAAAFFAFRTTLDNQPDPPSAKGSPIEVVHHEKPANPAPEADPLAQALDGVVAPERQDSEDAPGDADDSKVGDSEQDTSTATASIAAQEAPAPAAPAVPAVPAAQATRSVAEDIEVARNKLEAGLLDEAQKDVEELIAEFPHAELTPRAYLLLGQIHEQREDNHKALATYIELQSRFGESDEAVESLYRSAKLRQAEGGRENLRGARALLGELAKQHPGSEWAAIALVDKAVIETAEKWSVQDSTLKIRVPAALVTYRTLVAKYPAHSGAENALWKLGEMYEQLREFDLAVEAFETLGNLFPSTKHDVWWSAGQVYDRRLDDNQRAVAAYRKVLSNSRHHSDAQRRIAKLTR